MALRTLMLKKNLTDKQKELAAHEAHAEELRTRETEIETSINEVETEEERSAVEESIATYEADKAENEKDLEEIRAAIAKLEAELAEIEDITETTAPIEEARKEENTMETREMTNNVEERAAFANYVATGRIESRNDYNMQKSNNGAVVPKTVADEIIAKVAQLSPIFEKATRYMVKGQLDIPTYPASASHVINAAYASEFTDLEASSGDFSSVSLTGYLVGALSKISKSLVNNSDVDIVPFITDQMAKDFAAFIDNEALNGTSGKITGVLNEVTVGVQGALTADHLIDVQEKVPDAFQGNCCWIMNAATRAACRELKDTAGAYILASNFGGDGTGVNILGRPVYVSENMPDNTVLYGDLSGIAIKFSEELDVEVLTERYAPQHAIGVVGWTELDCKVANYQKLAKLYPAG